MLLPLVAMLAAGCSSDDTDALTFPDWAVAICAQRDALASAPIPTGLNDLAAFEQVADAFDDAVASLDDLDAPESARDAHDGFLTLYREISNAQRDFIEAATDADAAALDAATTEYQAQLQQAFNQFDTESITPDVADALGNAGCDT